jgi:hypothetical protein
MERLENYADMLAAESGQVIFIDKSQIGTGNPNHAGRWFLQAGKGH